MRTTRFPVSKLSVSLAAVAMAAALGLSACSQAEEAVNRGGDTHCNDYIGQDKDKQRVTVTKYLKEKNNGNEPAGNEVDAAMTAIDLLCRVQSNASVPIKNADLAGILTPK